MNGKAFQNYDRSLLGIQTAKAVESNRDKDTSTEFSKSYIKDF